MLVVDVHCRVWILDPRPFYGDGLDDSIRLGRLHGDLKVIYLETETEQGVSREGRDPNGAFRASFDPNGATLAVYYLGPIYIYIGSDRTRRTETETTPTAQDRPKASDIFWGGRSSSFRWRQQTTA